MEANQGRLRQRILERRRLRGDGDPRRVQRHELQVRRLPKTKGHDDVRAHARGGRDVAAAHDAADNYMQGIVGLTAGEVGLTAGSPPLLEVLFATHADVDPLFGLQCCAVWKSTSASGAPDNSSLSHFSAMTRPSWLGRAVRNQHRHAIEQASRRWRGGRRDDAARTCRKILISTQVLRLRPGPRRRRRARRRRHDARRFYGAIQWVPVTKLPYWAVRATSIRFGAADVLPADVAAIDAYADGTDQSIVDSGTSAWSCRSGRSRRPSRRSLRRRRTCRVRSGRARPAWMRRSSTYHLCRS